jgi:hypothetical protein
MVRKPKQYLRYPSLRCCGRAWCCASRCVKEGEGKAFTDCTRRRVVKCFDVDVCSVLFVVVLAHLGLDGLYNAAWYTMGVQRAVKCAQANCTAVAIDFAIVPEALARKL